jgi:uncharacterized protein (DUF885 family)
MPGQTIDCKLGERAWLLGRERARERHGEEFDLKAWHWAALSQGSLGLDDLETCFPGSDRAVKRGTVWERPT